ncbi:MAG: DUF2066 domain-containing protein [Alphaproteobacteria bacterium]|nr:DUF2066 domain-containing protein [Alphaproteobacteria bacterium]
MAMIGCHRASRRLPALLMLALSLAASGAAGQGRSPSDVFTIADVPVDATAASAAAAREAARLDGQRRAFRNLFERLTLAADRNRLPKASDTQITEMVRDFEVANERRSAVRYLADYTFRFRPEPVRQVLRNAGIPFAETMSKPVTVVPVLTQGSGSVLWDDPNPWREAWASRKGSAGLVPLIVPLGDASDVAAIDAEKAVAADREALAAIASRYGGGDALVAQAVSSGEGGALAVTVKRISGTAASDIAGFSVRPDAGESQDAVMTRAVAQSVAAIEDAWKRETLLPSGQEAVLTAEVPIGQLSDWLAVRGRLAGLAAIKDSTLLSLDKHAAEVEIHYLGDPGKLQLALAQRDLVLVQNGSAWTLQRRGAAGAAQ